MFQEIASHGERTPKNMSWEHTRHVLYTGVCVDVEMILSRIEIFGALPFAAVGAEFAPQYPGQRIDTLL